MKDGQPVPYGSWQSPITSDLIVSGGIGLELVACWLLAPSTRTIRASASGLSVSAD